ncbi:hypothetical protein LTR53_011854 [Teratosphaeriaceae sp. CCFEE 6253]|nr:hypothetical protein LTR53_011854 [Teratosphaeriaceae sp. CCFEE 6253]
MADIDPSPSTGADAPPQAQQLPAPPPPPVAATMRSSRKRIAAFRAELATLIAPFRTGRQLAPPPFSDGELTVLAAVCCMDVAQRTTAEDRVEWILLSLPYYGRQAVRNYVILKQGEERNWHTKPVVNVADALNKYDAPFSAIYVPGLSAWHELEINSYFVHVDQARAFLGRLLNPACQVFAHFLDLPPEVRMMVYDLLLVFDPAGITPSINGARKVHLTLPRRTTDVLRGSNDPSDQAKFAKRAEPDAPGCAALLAILRTSRMIHDEALPQFYRRNRFVFTRQGPHEHLPALKTFSHVLCCLAPLRFQFLSRVSLDFDVHIWLYDLRAPLLALRRLSVVQCLRWLELVFTSDTQYLKLPAPLRRSMGAQRRGCFVKVEQVPLIQEAAFVAWRAQQLVLSGTAPLIHAYILREVARVQATEDVGEVAEQERQAQAAKAKAKEARRQARVAAARRKAERKRQEALAARLAEGAARALARAARRQQEAAARQAAGAMALEQQAEAEAARQHVELHNSGASLQNPFTQVLRHADIARGPAEGQPYGAPLDFFAEGLGQGQVAAGPEQGPAEGQPYGAPLGFFAAGLGQGQVAAGPQQGPAEGQPYGAPLDFFANGLGQGQVAAGALDDWSWADMLLDDDFFMPES